MTAHRSTMRRATSIFLGALLVVQASGCTEWHASTAPTASEVEKQPRAQYRITTNAQRVVTLVQVHYRNDSILGRTPYVRDAPEIGLPMTEVATIEKHGANVAANVTLGALGIAVIIAAIHFANTPWWQHSPVGVSSP